MQQKPHVTGISSCEGQRLLSRRTLLIAGTVALVRPAIATAGSYRAILGSEDGATKQILDALTSRLPGLSASRDVGELKRIRQPSPVYIAIGPAALARGLAEDLDGPLLSVFTSRQAYDDALAAVAVPKRNGVTALYAEPAPLHQLMLARQLFGRRVAVAVVLSRATSHLESELLSAATAADVALNVYFLEASEHVARALVRVHDVSAVVAVPDRDVYNPSSLREALESTYRRRQPLIGYAPGFVSAGAIAAAYATIDDIVAQVPEVAAALAGGRVPPAQYPKYWRVAVNDSVARSLNIVIDARARELGSSPR